MLSANEQIINFFHLLSADGSGRRNVEYPTCTKPWTLGVIFDQPMGELNIKSSTIEKSLDLAKDFLKKLVGPTVDEIGFLFADNVKLWRLKNQIKNLEKVRKIVQEENVDIK